MNIPGYHKWNSKYWNQYSDQISARYWWKDSDKSRSIEGIYCSCNLFTEFIAGIVAEIHAVKVGVRKTEPGKGSKLDILAREKKSTEEKSAGYVGKDLLNTVGKQL